MKNIKVLGTGCANCSTTMTLIEQTAQQQNVSIELEKVEDLQQIMQYGVLSTPGVIIDGSVVHSGGIPSADTIKQWLSDGNQQSCCNEDSSTGCC